MVTPDRIPEFTIPSLDLLDEHKHLGKVKALEQMSRNTIKDCHRFPQGSFLTCCSRVELDLGVNDIPADSVTQAALSLPHLPKIITPYGFVSLGQSPHVTKEEALFFQFGLASSRDPNTQRDLDTHGGYRFHSDGDSVQAACTNISLRDHCPYRAQVVSQAHLSKSNSSSIKNGYRLKLSDAGEVQDADVFSKPAAFLATTCSNLDGPSLSLQKSPKTRFQKILKKHCAHLGNLKGMKMPSRYPTTDATCHSKESETWAVCKK